MEDKTVCAEAVFAETVCMCRGWMCRGCMYVQRLCVCAETICMYRGCMYVQRLYCRDYRRHRRPGFNPWVEKIPWEEEMTTHSSILAWKIQWTEEPGGLQSMRSQRVRYDWATEYTPAQMSRKVAQILQLILIYTLFIRFTNFITFLKITPALFFLCLFFFYLNHLRVSCRYYVP